MAREWCFNTNEGRVALVWSFLISAPISVGLYLLSQNLLATSLISVGIWMFAHFVTDGLIKIYAWVVRTTKK